MSKRKSHNSDSQPDEQAATQQDEQPEAQPGEQADSLMKQLEVTLPPPRRRRPAAPPPEPLQLDPEFVNNPQRMQYALLLALLLRQKSGSATFSQKDMAHQDTDYNILFARTLDGKGLEVTVVSSESGIIRSPAKEREAEKWRKEQEDRETQMMMTAFNPLPPSSMPSLMSSIYRPDGAANSPYPVTGSSPGGGLGRVTDASPVQFQPGANPGGGFAIPPATGPQQTAEVIQLPNRSPTETTDGSNAYHFPFQVGTNPQDAKGPAAPMTLNQVHQQLLDKDQEIQNQELEAMARQERGEYPEKRS